MTMEYLLTRTFSAEAAVAKRRIVRLGSADGKARPADGPTDTAVGVSAELDADKDARVDVHLAGIAAVEAGGAVARGARVTAGAGGKAAAAGRAALGAAVVDGAAANTDIAVAGPVKAGALAAVVELAGAASVDRTSAFEIRADGKLRGTAATDGKKLLVVWRGPPVSVVGVALTAAAAEGDSIRVLIQPGAG